MPALRQLSTQPVACLRDRWSVGAKWTFPAEGSYVVVLYGPSAMDREHPRGRTLMVRDGKRDKVRSLTSLPLRSRLRKLWRKPHLSRPS